MKYWKTKFRGEKPAHEIHAAVGKDGAHVLRVHVEKGETQVYFAGGDEKDRGKRLKQSLGADEPVEASEKDVTRLG